MLRILCAAIVLALAKCDTDDLKIFEGQWTPVKVFTDLPLKVDPECATFSLELTTDQCKHGNNKIPVFQATDSKGVSLKLAVVPMDTDDDDIEEAFDKKCSCKNKKIRPDFLLFRYLSEKYFILYNAMAGPNVAVLMAKEVPTEEDLEKFEQSSVLKDEKGLTLCTKETSTRRISSSGNTDTDKSSMKWLNYRTTTTTTEPSN